MSKLSDTTITITEVSYKEEATELFLAIEEMEWRDAFGIISSDPKQVRTWVNNYATEDTIASWRRLPIHEACIRRAPAWLVSELLSAFQESSSLTTDLGEYPLHLAVDKACAPEVVNLIIVANWHAIVARDQTGRTPLDIINQTELLEIEGNKVIFQSLKRCHKTYSELQKKARDEKAALNRKQKAQSCVVSKRHQEELKRERTKHANLKEEMEELKKELRSARELTRDKDDEIQKHLLAKDRYLETIQELRTKEEGQQNALETERAKTKGLLFKLDQKEGEIQRKNTKLNALSKDLKSIALSNETDIMESLMETEQSMRTMVSTQIALQKLLGSKSHGLKTLLKQRGIAFPDALKHNQPPKEEEKSVHDDDDENHDYAMEDTVATAAMMAAATAALKTVA